MSTVINEAYDITGTEELIVFVDVRQLPVFSILTAAGSGAALEVTITAERINQGETPNWVTPVDISGVDIGTISPDSMATIRGPFEAVRLKVDGESGNCVGRFMQSGAQ